MSILTTPSATLASSTAGVNMASCSYRTANFDAGSLNWREAFAATPEDWGGFTIHGQCPTGKAYVAVAIGPAGSEQVIVTAPMTVYHASYGFSIYVPIPIPAGTRVSVDVIGNSLFEADVSFVGYPATLFDALPSFSKMEFGPIDFTGSYSEWGDAVTLDPGPTANTKGAWTEISMPGQPANDMDGASLPYSYDYLGLILKDTNNGQSDHDKLIDFAVGPSGSEEMIVENLFTMVSGGEYMSIPSIVWMPWGRPAGERISARVQASTTDVSDRLIYATLIGLR